MAGRGRPAPVQGSPALKMRPGAGAASGGYGPVGPRGERVTRVLSTSVNWPQALSHWTLTRGGRYVLVSAFLRRASEARIPEGSASPHAWAGLRVLRGAAGWSVGPGAGREAQGGPAASVRWG